jgi:ornithine cyclodeaminase/alanine dehydrogenase-like protein (mu-crystallin family)
MKLIDSKTIGKAAPIEKWVLAMEQALKDTATGVVEVPQRMHIDRGPNTLLLMPCFGEKYFSTKLVSMFPKNRLKKEPVIYGTVVLNDGQTGKPLAVLDGGKLTAMRTAAVGAVGIKYLAPAEASRLGIIGLGIQGFHQALFACQQRPIRQVRIIDHSKEIMDRFAKSFNAFYPKTEVIQCKTSADLCHASDIIITATGSHQPVVPGSGEWWKGKTMIGIGSYKPDMKEYPDEIFRDVNQVFVDTLHANTEAGDLVDPLRKGLIDEKDVVPIADLILQKSKALGDTRFFKSVGMAAFDLYGAKLVYECIKS